MKKTNILTTAIITAFLAGCASYGAGNAPTPVRFNGGAQGEQQKIQALSHWQLIAADMAKNAAKDLGGKDVIVKSQDKTVFDKTFSGFLTTALVENGTRVNTTSASTRISVDSIQIRFRNNRDTDPAPGTFTALAAGLLVLGNAASTWSPSALAAGAVALGVAADVGTMQKAKFAGPIPKTEIAVTVTATEAGHIAFRKTSIYYTDEIDANLYEEQRGLKVVNQ